MENHGGHRRVHPAQGQGEENDVQGARSTPSRPASPAGRAAQKAAESRARRAKTSSITNADPKLPESNGQQRSLRRQHHQAHRQGSIEEHCRQYHGVRGNRTLADLDRQRANGQRTIPEGPVFEREELPKIIAADPVATAGREKDIQGRTQRKCH